MLGIKIPNPRDKSQNSKISNPRDKNHENKKTRIPGISQKSQGFSENPEKLLIVRKSGIFGIFSAEFVLRRIVVKMFT